MYVGDIVYFTIDLRAEVGVGGVVVGGGGAHIPVCISHTGTVWRAPPCPAIHLWQIFYLARCSKRLLLINYAAAGPRNKLRADSTPCVWLKI